MAKISPFNVEKICSECGSKRLSRKQGSSETYCEKCGTVMEEFMPR